MACGGRSKTLFRHSGCFCNPKLFEPVAHVVISEYYQLLDLDGTLEYLGVKPSFSFNNNTCDSCVINSLSCRGSRFYLCTRDVQNTTGKLEPNPIYSDFDAFYILPQQSVA